jgi:hypothetical protein
MGFFTSSKLSILRRRSPLARQRRSPRRENLHQNQRRHDRDGEQDGDRGAFHGPLCDQSSSSCCSSMMPTNLRPCSFANAFSSSMSGSVSAVKNYFIFHGAFTSGRRYLRSANSIGQAQKAAGHGPALTLSFIPPPTQRDSVGPATPAVRTDMISYRAQAIHSKRMTMPAWPAPKSRPASFGNLNDRAVDIRSRCRFHRCAGCIHKTKDKRATQTNYSCLQDRFP